MMKWIHPQEPVRKAVKLDFTQKTLQANIPPGTAKVDTLFSVEHSPGDWTLYLERQLSDFDESAIFVTPATIDRIVAQVGYGEAQDEQIITLSNQVPPAFFAWGGRNRAQMLHYHGETVQVRVEWTTSVNAPPETDRLIGWISPSRPARYDIPFVATIEQPVNPPPYVLTSIPIRIPVWATEILVAPGAFDFVTGQLVIPATVWVSWHDWANVPTGPGPGTAVVTPGQPIPVPIDARFVRFVRPVGAVATTDFVSGTFRCRS